MTCRSCIRAIIVLTVFSLLGCHSPYYRDQGAGLGALTGAGLGAAIGEANDEPLAGAAIGSVLGAVTGGAVGQALDQVAQASAETIAINSGAAIGDVVAMTQAGLSDEVIIRQIQSQGMAGPLSTDALISLKQQGVSDQVVRALQEPIVLVPRPQPIYGPPPPVPVVVSPSIIVPRGRRRYPSPYHRGTCRPHGNVRWGIAVGN